MQSLQDRPFTLFECALAALLLPSWKCAARLHGLGQDAIDKLPDVARLEYIEKQFPAARQHFW